MNYTWEIVKIIFYLSLVLALIYLINYYLKKAKLGTQTAKYINIIEQVYLAPRKSLILVLVEKKILLLSVSEKSVEVLDTWAKEDFSQLEFAETKSFKNYLHNLMANRWKKNE